MVLVRPCGCQPDPCFEARRLDVVGKLPHVGEAALDDEAALFFRHGRNGGDRRGLVPSFRPPVRNGDLREDPRFQIRPVPPRRLVAVVDLNEAQRHRVAFVDETVRFVALNGPRGDDGLDVGPNLLFRDVMVEMVPEVLNRTTQSG